MAANAISNANLTTYCAGSCQITGFTPTVTYAYDAGAATVTVTNASTIPAGDTFLKAKVHVYDQFGGEVRGQITVAATPLVVDVSTLNRSKSLAVKVTVLTTLHIAADGGAYGLGTAGTVNNWDVQQNAQ